MIRLATLFSGIGAIEQAFIKLDIEHKIIFACDNGERFLSKTEEEIKNELDNLTSVEKKQYVDDLYASLNKPNYMEESYMYNYKLGKEHFYQDIRFLDGTLYNNQVDLLVGGSPCQSFSIIGKRGGFKDTRGTLFYEYARIIKEVQPKAFIFENVRGMLNHDKGRTWETVKNTFEELNYKIYIKDDPILNAKDYGIPQNRPRLFVIGIRNDLDTLPFKFPEPVKLDSKVSDYLDNKVDPKYYLAQKGFEFVTNPKYKNRAQVNSDIMMCQKANQQFNWNGEFVFEKLESINNPKILDKAYVGTYNGEKGVCRKLTPIECVRLMGFSEKFKFPDTVPDVEKYRQSGNSIVVNIFEKILPNLVDTKVFELNYNCLANILQSNKIRLATLFSGIGAIEQALIRNNTPYEIEFACDNGDVEIDYDYNEVISKIKSMDSKIEKKKYVDNLYASKSRKQNYVKQSYMANYGNKINEEDFHLDVRLLDGTDYYGKVDLLVGGSPCQSFSAVGFKGGLEDARGTLFYEYARIVKEVQPKVFIYENVRGMLTHDKGNTWNVINGIFKSLNYKITEPQILNAVDYGIPQNRRRIFVIGIRNDVNIKQEFKYPNTIELPFKLKDLLESHCEYGNYKYNEDGSINLIKSEFDPDRIDEKYVLSDLVRKYVLSPGTKTFKTTIKYDLDIARTVLSTMGNRHRAGVDNYFTDKGGENRLRMLTEREALRLMGYSDEFKIVVSRAQMYKQAGNSIVVDVMLAVLKEIIKTGAFENNEAINVEYVDSSIQVINQMELNFVDCN